MQQVILLYLLADSAIHAVSQRYEKQTSAMLMRRLTYGLLACVIGVALAKSIRRRDV